MLAYKKSQSLEIVQNTTKIKMNQICLASFTAA